MVTFRLSANGWMIHTWFSSDEGTIAQAIRHNNSMYEWQRIRRLLWPAKYDHAAYMLINIVGRWWLFLTGWKREYRIVGKERLIIVDLAHPRLKLALEADGERWHRDIVHEQERDEALKGTGWSVRHYRYPELNKHPRKVKRQVRRWFWNALILGFRR